MKRGLHYSEPSSGKFETNLLYIKCKCSYTSNLNTWIFFLPDILYIIQLCFVYKLKRRLAHFIFFLNIFKIFKKDEASKVKNNTEIEALVDSVK